MENLNIDQKQYRNHNSVRNDRNKSGKQTSAEGTGAGAFYANPNTYLSYVIERGGLVFRLVQYCNMQEHQQKEIYQE